MSLSELIETRIVLYNFPDLIDKSLIWFDLVNVLTKI